MAITIRDVAEKAGVSVTTVSRTLNNRGYISRETREKIAPCDPRARLFSQSAGQKLV